ncbi:replication initiator [Streptomyces sp. NPDC026206]|uniref:replication initiator n=1 Tax=Streptomyces sp. NPDC026206 TaxID=3157089 RepID=UPI0033D4D14E
MSPGPGPLSLLLELLGLVLELVLNPHDWLLSRSVAQPPGSRGPARPASRPQPHERPPHGRHRPTNQPPRRFGGPPREVPTIRADTTTSADRRAALDRAARLRQLPEVDQDVIRLAADPLFPRLLEQITATGGCAHPIHLSGHTTTHDTTTGEILHHYDTRNEPGERLLVRCRNRRENVCPPCSRLHAGDTFHLVRAGLTGGKTVPPTVREHPRLFVTLTAPSFGPVHRTTTDGKRCRPRRNTTGCEHSHPQSCPRRHEPTDPLVGQPLCPGCYDYTGHVLWHAHAGELWSRFTRNVRRHLAAAAGIVQSRFPDHARLSFAKVSEYQQRAAIHVHAVIRLDGPAGPGEPAPAWGTAELLTNAAKGAALRVLAHTPYSPALGEYALRWGTELDARPLRASQGPDGLSDDAVAAYIAKYVTKGSGTTGTASGADYRFTSAHNIARAAVTPHIRNLMRTCWNLGDLPEFQPLHLRAWAHTLGYRGHILTKSLAYSTTYTALRAERANHERRETGISEVVNAVTDSAWRYIDSGHTPGAALIAAGIAEDLIRNRLIAHTETRAPARAAARA